MAELFNITHDGNNLSEYDSTTTDGGDLSTSQAAAMGNSAYGMQAVIDDSTSIYGVKNISAPSSDLRVRFYLDPNGYSTTSLSGVCAVRLASSPNWIAMIVLGHDGSTTNRIRARAWHDSGSDAASTYANITDEPHYIEYHLERATTSSSNDGQLRVWIDGVLSLSITSLDNYNIFADIEAVWLGANIYNATNAGVTIYLDEMRANDTGTEIGPANPSVSVGDADLQALWRMEETSGTRYDTTANDNDLTDNNTVASSTTAKRGSRSASFTASNSEYLSITDAAQTGLDITGEITLMAWFRLPTRTGIAQPIIGKWDTASNLSYYMDVELGDGDQISFNVSDDGTTVTYGYGSPDSPFSTNTWYHVAAVYDGSYLRIYLDGTEVTNGNTPYSYSSDIYDGSSPVYIGRTDTSYFSGLLDEVAIFSRALTPGEIDSIYNGGIEGASASASLSPSSSPSRSASPSSSESPSISPSSSESPSLSPSSSESPSVSPSSSESPSRSSSPSPSISASPSRSASASVSPSSSASPSESSSPSASVSPSSSESPSPSSSQSPSSSESPSVSPSGSSSQSPSSSASPSESPSVSPSSSASPSESPSISPSSSASPSESSSPSSSVSPSLAPGDEYILIEDTGTGTESLAAPIKTVRDSGGIYTEIVTTLMAVVTDTGTGSDTVTRPGPADTATGSDTVSIAAQITISDTATGTDTLAFDGPDVAAPGSITVGALEAAHVIRLCYGNDKRNPDRTLDLADSAGGNIFLRQSGSRFGSGQRNELWSGRSIRFDGQQKLAESRDNAELTVMYDLSATTGAGLAYFQRKVNRFLNEAKLYQEQRSGAAVWLEYRWSDGLGSLPTPKFGQLSQYYRVLAGNVPEWPQDIHKGQVLTGNIEEVALELTCSPYPEGLRQQIGYAAGDVTNSDAGTLVSSGSSSNLRWPSYANSGLTGEFTVAGWITCDWGTPPAGSVYIFDYYINAANRISIIWDGANSYWTITKIVGGVTATDNSDVVSISDGDNVHLALVQDDTTIYLFQDGTEVASAAATASMTDGGTIALGSAATGTTDGADVALDGWRIFAQALTSAQIGAIYTAETPVKNDGGSVGAPAWFYTKHGSGELYNKDDDTYEFYGIIGGVEGDVPARLETKVTPGTWLVTGSNTRFMLWFGLRAFDSKLTDTEYYYLSNFTGTADSDSCYDEYLQDSVTASTDTQYRLSTLSDWLLSAASTTTIAEPIRGRFQMLARIQRVSGTMTATGFVQFDDSDGNTRQSGTAVSLSGTTFKLYDLGSFYIDWPLSSENIGPGEFDFGAMITGTGSYNLDYIYLLPYPVAKVTATDYLTNPSVLYVKTVGTQAAIYDAVDHLEDIFEYVGRPLELVPRKYNYLWCIEANNDLIYGNYSKTLKLWMTPRYLLPGGMVA